jgi:C1A family cysteine protease
MIARYRDVGGKLRHVVGWRPEAGDHRFAAAARSDASALYELPRRVDNSERWPAIKDQGVIGDCTANGVLECYEYFQPVGERRPLSRLYLYAYSRLAEGTPLDEDSGAQVGTAVQVLSDRGAPYESDWDYTDYQTRFREMPPAELDPKAAEHKALFWYPCPDLFTLKASLAQGFPAVFGFRCPENMFGPECMKTGLIHYPEPGEGYDGGHSTGIAGYDDDLRIGSEIGALKIPNSWGAGAGQEGYFFLPYRFVLEGIAASICSVRRVSGVTKEKAVLARASALVPPLAAGGAPALQVGGRS